MHTFLRRAFIALFIFSLPALSFAATCIPNDPNNPGIQCPLDESNFTSPIFLVNLINKVANWLFTFLLVLAVVFIVIAAYKYMFSQGNEESVSAAHKMLIYAAVAVAVAMLSRGFVVVVRELITSSTGSSGTPTATPPVATPPASPSTPMPTSFLIRDDAGTNVTSPTLPSGNISLYSCTLASGASWFPAFKFTGVPTVTKVQGGCSGACLTSSERTGSYNSYPLSAGVTLMIEKCEDGTSPAVLYNAQRFGGTP